MGSRDQLLNDPEEALRLAFDGRLSTMWTALPGIVSAVDLTKMTVSVQPAIQGIVQDENGRTELVNLPLLVDVPLSFPSVAGFCLTLPVAAGDEVLVVFSSRCIDAWWQLGGVQRPMEARMHDLSDGFAIPGIRSVPNVIPSISSTGAQLRNNAGTTYVEISGDGKVKIVTSSQVEVQGILNVTGNVVASGNVTANGEVTAKASLVPVNLSTHTHGGVTVGGGSTGGPVG